jgi:hypothetical protein
MGKELGSQVREIEIMEWIEFSYRDWSIDRAKEQRMIAVTQKKF